jgi:RNA polymerase sigma factor (sigma-70 family)
VTGQKAEALAAFLAHANEESRARLIQSYLPKVRQMVWAHHARGRLAGFDPEDVISDASIGLVAAVDSFRPELGGFNAWAETKIRGAILDAVKSTARQIAPLSLDTDSIPERDLPTSPDPAHAVLLTDESSRLRAAIEGLPSPLSECLSLYYYEQLNLREIGERFGVSERRAGQIHQKALSALRERAHTDASLEDALRN